MGSFENKLPEHVLFVQLDRMINWARSNSLSYITADLACCGIEIAQLEGPRFDIERFGSVPQTSPEHADLLIVAGTLTYKSIEALKEMYDLIPNPKYVLAIGSCACGGGMFNWEYSYSSVSGTDKVFPVDVYVPGCPPRPEAILHGLLTLQKKIFRSRVLVRDDLKQARNVK